MALGKIIRGFYCLLITCVTGLMVVRGLSVQVTDTPLSGGVAFVKEADVYVTSDYWKVVVNFDFTDYEDVITTLRTEITEMVPLTESSTQIAELKQVLLQVNFLEAKLAVLKEYLPRAETRRGLLNAGGSVLKALFGTATMLDLKDLHSTVDELHRKEELMVHSLNQQVSYLKSLDGNVKANVEAIFGLSGTLKNILNKTRESFQNVAAKLAWLNKQTEAASVIRSLESELTKLEVSISELQVAFQFVLIGKIPLNLINPRILKEILRNVSMVLPDGYTLILGLRPNNMIMYYDIVKAAMFADLRSFKLILNVPLKADNRYFELYRTVALPQRTANKGFVRFVLDKEYFAINPLQRAYFAMTEVEASKCTGNFIKICPADHAVYSTEVKSCVSSLYLQSREVQDWCKRELMINPGPDLLERHGTEVLYYTSEVQTLQLQCNRNRSWQSQSMTLQGAGILGNAGPCFLSLPALHLYPTLRGEAALNARAPVVYAPKHPKIITDMEAETLGHVSLLHDTALDQLIANQSTRHLGGDVDQLIYLHANTQGHAKEHYTLGSCLIAAGSILIFFLMYYFTHSYWQRVLLNCVNKCRGKSNTPSTDQPPSTSTSAVTLQPNLSKTNERQAEPTATSVCFSTYSLQST